jgi:hypothetical protein
MFFSVADALVEPNSVPLRPPIWVAPPPLTWYWNTVSPAENTALPETEMLVNTVFELLLATRSPRWPPQPTFTPSGPSACQVDCWSLCEPSAFGRGLTLATYSARVSGCTSGPALARIARRFAANRFATSGMLGCSAYVNALFSGETVNFGAIARTPPRRSGDASAAVGTTGVPGAFSAIDSGATERRRVYSLNDAASVRSTMCDESLPP